MKDRKTSRRAMLTTILPAAALASAAGVASAVAGTTRLARPRALDQIPIHTVEYSDPIADWVVGRQDFICCTPEERAALLVARPEMARWYWMDLGDRFVGKSPQRKAGPLSAFRDDQFTEKAEAFIARLDEVKARRQQHQAGA